jgi:hypothetical protein
MRRSTEYKVVLSDLRGGRNDTDPPMSLRADQCVEMLNVDQKDTTFARKRGGASAVTDSGGTAFSSGIQEIGSYVPGASETARELWATDGAATPIVKRMAAGTTFADVTVDDAIATKPQDVVAVTFNGKRFMAYDSTQDRLHVYDPALASPRVRRVGFADPTTAPTVANTGAGAYAAVLRYYRVRFIHISAVTGLLVRRSEPTDSVSFTPSGAGSAARVTQPTAPGEGETHWEVEASTDNVTFFVIAGVGAGTSSVVIATTTLDDTLATTAYAAEPLSDVVGSYAPFPSVKYLLTDSNRLLGAGAWETSGTNSGGKSSRVWFTPVLGSADRGDDERLVNTTVQKNWVDLNENDGGSITGLGGPINGMVIAFKYRQVHKLRPTGDVAAPFLPRKMRDDVGCISHKSIAIGEDQIGRPALYFMSHRGPYRVTFDGAVEYLGRDNEVTWRSMNLSATTVVCHSVFYPDLHQWWVWIATDAANDPDVKMVFDVQKGFPDEHGEIRGGWFKHTSSSAAARCSCLMSNTLGATMSRDLKPYIGRASGTAIWKTDTSDLDDAGTDFQAYVKPRPIITAGELGRKIGMGEPYLLAKVLTGVTVQLTSDRDFGKETRTHTVTLTAESTESRIFKKFEGGEVGEADVLSVQIGDAAAQEGAWSFDALIVPTLPQEPK